MASRFWYIFSKCHVSVLLSDKYRGGRKILFNSYMKVCGTQSSKQSRHFPLRNYFPVNFKKSCVRHGIAKTYLLLGAVFNWFGWNNNRKKENKWEAERELIHEISLAELALKDGNTEKAAKILECALDVAEKKHVLVGLACVYDMLATIAYKQGQAARAEGLLVRSIEKLVKLGVPESDNQIVNFSLKLSRIYSVLGQDELAETSFKNCIAMQKPKIYNACMEDEETGLLWISILFWYGKFLIGKKRIEEAKALLEQAYAMSAHVKGIQTAQVMVILYHLSETSFASKEYDNALRYLINALILGKDSTNPDLPMFYVRAGMTYLYREMYENAKLWCEKGKKYAKLRRNKDAEEEANICLKKLDTMLSQSNA